jgi:RND family efflux transporter MFP subunit
MSRRGAAIVGGVAVAIAAALVFNGAAGRPEGPLQAGHNTDHPAEHATAHAAGVHGARAPLTIDAERQRALGLRMVRVERRQSAFEVRAAAVAAYDETREVEISARVDGWVRDLRASATGRVVRAGERLFTLYSPEVLATEQEYLLAVAGVQQHGQNPTLPETRDHALRLLQAARDRLTLWDVSAAEIDALEKRNKAQGTTAILSPRNGVVVEKGVVEGMRVAAGQRLFRIADLSSVWVEAAVPEREIRFIRPGQDAAVELDAYPGETFQARVIYLYPSVDAATRTVKLRMQLANPEGRIRPGMYGTVVVTATGDLALVVPADAVAQDGPGHLVFIAADGAFTPRPIRIGRRLGETFEVVSGLREGETVAAGATFLLASASRR